MSIEIVIADYANEQHKTAIPALLNAYASDPMGGGKPLTEHVRRNLVNELAKIPHAFSVLAFVDGEPAGLTNCFAAFSTFACKPLINIHDLMVLQNYRGLGLSQLMLAKVEEIARAKDCCKVTLEVLSNNAIAKSAYLKYGFSGYELDPQAGNAVFWQKSLNSTN
ncbi:GNAT family N-acetyltransferase [Paraglaciecola hydrolytica]|uniref:GNAT family acetyltransferase n=1 Tax=Paraglaciecola hydrolytica TaxID=1799789 RepID=A0A136A0G4_9ALTE|nr:GNAT family N-acetyltransferase [Paraglaciecola hydrolytica]KXI28640.1 GNAT family acetyltransferase [Paraglaciecola hydrolytica]